ncbi:Translocator protein, partial [Phalacrocorax carbo]
VFAPACGTLWLSVGYGSYLAWKELGSFHEKSVVPLGLYAGQLALNCAQAPVMFGAHETGWRLMAVMLMTGRAAATTASWYNSNKTAAYLMATCLAWLTMASRLSYCTWNNDHNQK